MTITETALLLLLLCLFLSACTGNSAHSVCYAFAWNASFWCVPEPDPVRQETKP